MQRANTLVARHPGTQGQRILLIGHLDTVFTVDSPFQSFSRHGDIAKGPGVIDDKGGDIVILYALKALAEAKLLSDRDITVILTGDEEDSGTIARRGISQWKIWTEGQESHSADIFHRNNGAGAIYELTRILEMIRSKLHREKYLTFNPGLITGGTLIKQLPNHTALTVTGKENVIAKTAFAAGDMRFLTDSQKQQAEILIKKTISHHLPVTHASITFEPGIPSMPPSRGNLALLQKYSEVSQALGQGVIKPIDPSLRGADDISYIAAYVASALSGLGPSGNNAHSVQETLNIPSLTTQTQRAAILIYRLTQKK